MRDAGQHLQVVENEGISMKSRNLPTFAMALLLLASLVSCNQPNHPPRLDAVVKTVAGDPVARLPIEILGLDVGGVTDERGKVSIELPSGRGPGTWVMVQLVPQADAKEQSWVLLKPWNDNIQVRSVRKPVPIVVARRGDRELLLGTSAGRVAISQQILTQREKKEAEVGQPTQLGAEVKETVLAELAAQQGLEPREIDTAIGTSLRTATDPFEKGLAALYSERYPEAQQALQNALVAAQQESAEAPERLVESARFLGRAFMEAHQYGEAAGAYRQAMALKPLDPDLLQLLGLASLASGDYLQARLCFEKLTEMGERLLGAQHPLTLNAMNNLAETLSRQGNLSEARQLQQRVLQASESMLGAEHPGTLTAKGNLAASLRSEGELSEAQRMEEEVLEVRMRSLGAEHPDTLATLSNLGTTLHAQGDLAGARRFQEQVLERTMRVLGAEHPNTLTAMNNLAATLAAQGDLSAARRLDEQVLEVSTRVLGAEHPDTVTSEWNLLQTAQEQGDTKTVEALAQRLSRLLGREPALLSARENRVRQKLIDLLEKQKQNGTAQGPALPGS